MQKADGDLLGLPKGEPSRMPISRAWKQTSVALRRARFGILSISLSYIVSVAIGIAMVSTGNRFAIRHRDTLVTHANATSPILKALNSGREKTAAALDFGANLVGGTASLVAGYWAPAAYPVVVYRGWIGGIVSVNGKHRSRLSGLSQAFYYIVTLVLQLIPYSLAGGAGVMIGLARARPIGVYAGPKFLTIPTEALRDAARIYALAVPFFAIASAFEFLCSP